MYCVNKVCTLKILFALSIIILTPLFTIGYQESPVKTKRGGISKQTIINLQQTNISTFDSTLPDMRFESWLRYHLGNAKFTWQIGSCGIKPFSLVNEDCLDQKICSKVTATLIDNRKVILLVKVGSAKLGVYKSPSYFYGILEKDSQLYHVSTISNLPAMLKGQVTNDDKVVLIKERFPVICNNRVALLSPYIEQPVSIKNINGRIPSILPIDDPPPPPVFRNRSAQTDLLTAEFDPIRPNMENKVIWADAITKVPPQYPLKARRFNTKGLVQVRVTISDDGKVSKAEAISGPHLLREAAVNAALQWRFRPTIHNGSTVVTEIILKFSFDPDH